MPDPNKPPRISPVTIGRRSVLEWLGGGVALGLSAAVLGCDDADPASAGPADSAPGDLGSPPDLALAPDSGSDMGLGDLYAPNAAFPFSPGSGAHKVYKTWWERTVDKQEIKKILASWKLTVDGLVDKPRTFTFAELVAFERYSMIKDFHCVEGWSIYDIPWDGARLSTLLAAVKPKSTATHVSFHTIGAKYNDSFPLAVAQEPNMMLGYGVGGNTLPLKHGFPLRVVAPRLLGYKNAKFVERVELTNKELHGYWVAAGYPYKGEVSSHRLRKGKY